MNIKIVIIIKYFLLCGKHCLPQHVFSMMGTSITFQWIWIVEKCFNFIFSKPAERKFSSISVTILILHHKILKDASNCHFFYFRYLDVAPTIRATAVHIINYILYILWFWTILKTLAILTNKNIIQIHINNWKDYNDDKNMWKNMNKYLKIDCWTSIIYYITKRVFKYFAWNFLLNVNCLP